VLIDPAESMNLNAANALLKVLEEPPADVVFLLVSDALQKLLPTLRSRCRIFPLTAPSQAQALAWLNAHGEADAAVELAHAGGAPFALDDAAALAAQVSVLESRDEGFALLDASVEEPMKTAIRAAGSEGDSVGGILETAILGLPAGVGEPYFDSVESLISHMAFSVPAVKGIEFGTGFGFADLKGSEANDAFRMKGDSVVTATNHNAGINGGITNGMPVVFRTAVKPTPSIYKEQETVDYIAKQDAPLSIQGRHDPCIVPRAAIVQTCAAALAVGDLMTARYGTAWMERPTSYRREGL
jgi:chorismate synthase